MENRRAFTIRYTELLFLALFMIWGTNVYAGDAASENLNFRSGLIRSFDNQDDVNNGFLFDLHFKEVTRNVLRLFRVDTSVDLSRAHDVKPVLDTAGLVPDTKPTDAKRSEDVSSTERLIILTPEGELKLTWVGSYVNTLYDIQKNHIVLEFGSQTLNRFLPDSMKMEIQTIPEAGSVGLIFSSTL